MRRLLSLLEDAEIFRRFSEALKTKRTIEITNTTEDFAVFFVIALYHMTDRDILVVNHNLYHAQKTYDSLSALLDGDVDFFPQDEFLTTEMLAMSEELKFQRLETVTNLFGKKKNLVVTHTTGLVKHLLPRKRFEGVYATFKVGDDVDLEKFFARLVELGYQATPTVEKVGEFARRGSIVDIYLPDHDDPVRIDFFDTEIDSLRHFDVKTQRSKKRLDAFTLTPRAEFFYTAGEGASIEKNVRERLEREDFSEDTVERVAEELEALKNHEKKDQLARYMAFLDEDPETITDYLDDPLLVTIDHERIKSAYVHIRDDLAEWMMESGDYPKLGFSFLKDPDKISYAKRIALNPLPMEEPSAVRIPLRVKEGIRYNNNIHMFMKDLKRYEGHVTVLVTLTDEKRLDRLTDILEGKVPYRILGSDDPPFKKSLNLVVQDNPLSFEWFDASFVLLSDADIFKEVSPKKSKRRRRVFKDTERVPTAESLQKGDYIVHYDHGIGRFLGIETMEVQDKTNDYIVIAYKGDDKLYIPVESIHLIQRYVASEGTVPKLNKLGSAEWAKTKRRVRKKAADIAAGLIELYAARKRVKGHAFSEDTDLMTEFEAEFLYEETEDQKRAIEAVKADMEEETPMDRLICGDVGYGKTEVALRAAFKAVLDNKQVVYLAPTTVLSRQHYYTFKDRLERHGVKVALLNRFVRRKRQKEFIKGIEEGTVDVVIGTHRLLSRDIRYKNLGLLIVDEEQRFGVEHKEKIKQLKLNIDVLSLSATPIPRTLQMAMTDVKQMSLIETPPKDRFPVQTYVLRRNDHVIKDAIERELGRKGQIFSLHNRIETIEEVAHNLRKLVPDARIGVAHGRMDRFKLENVMRGFLDHRFDVLVSTTIIETGLDIPNANTLIVHEADRLGLAQLYQIRGRVGRSNRIAYSYLMYDKEKKLNEEAAKRLQAIKEFTELGSGYKIAQRDLAIRGAGDLLGTEQSGFIDSVGIDLFMEILKEEIDKAKDETGTEDTQVTEERRKTLKLAVSRSIPEDYIPDDDQRVAIHRRIAALRDREELKALQEECEDRFGPLPEDMRIYMYAKLYENLALAKDVEKVREDARRIVFTLSKEASQNIHGDLLFGKANELSRFIHLNYKQGRLSIMIEKGKVSRHPLEFIVPLLESI